jgi:hypothetical protein
MVFIHVNPMKNPKKLFVLTGITVVFILLLKKIMVLGMIVVGAVIFPEASKALRHYCFGNGETLVVESDYIRKSPVVQKHLQKMKVGDVKKVSFRQKEDWRLSYALNPFTIKKRRNKVVITQWMQFDKTNKVRTRFGPFLIPDNIVHTFDCTPYLFYHEFPL